MQLLCKLVEDQAIWRTFFWQPAILENARKWQSYFDDTGWLGDVGAFVLWPPRSHERINIHLAKSSHCEMLVLWQLASSSTLPFCSPTPLSAHIKHNHNIQPPSCQKLGWALSGYLGSGHELQVVIVRVSRHCQGTSSSGCFRWPLSGYPGSVANVTVSILKSCHYQGLQALSGHIQ